MLYNEYTLQDFLNDDMFVRWVLFKEQDTHWQQVLKNDQIKKEILGEAVQLVRQLHQAEAVRNLPADEDRTWKRIRSTTIDADLLVELPRKRKWASLAVLCTLVLGLAVWQWVQYSGSESVYSELVRKASEKNMLIEKINKSDIPMRIALEDGTVVYLKKNGRFSYPSHFKDQSRETFLSGEASFEVAPNPKKPFYVYANELVTQVLGTSFDIKAFDYDRQVKVKVRTGRVSVYNQKPIRLASDENQNIVLLPNQQVIFNRQTESLSKQLVVDPLPVQPLGKNERKHFEEVPATTVLKALERLYGVHILYDEELLSHCIITTALSTQPLKDQLEVICQTIGATYKEMDAQLIVESSGCH